MLNTVLTGLSSISVNRSQKIPGLDVLQVVVISVYKYAAILVAYITALGGKPPRGQPIAGQAASGTEMRTVADFPSEKLLGDRAGSGCGTWSKGRNRARKAAWGCSETIPLFSLPITPIFQGSGQLGPAVQEPVPL